VLGDFCEFYGLTVAGGILIVGVFAFPILVGGGDLLDIIAGEFLLGAGDHGADLASIDEEGFALAVASGGAVLALTQNPDADGDLGGEEELTGESDHAVDEVVLDDFLADGTF